MTQPTISVVITAYNYGRFIEECIDSVLSQDYPPDKREIVVVDDGSTDNTAEQLKKYGSKIKYFLKPNGGQASALNLGFAMAKGEIVSLLDADDYFLPGKLTRVAEAFEQDPALGMFYHPFLGFDAGTGERRIIQFPPLISGSPYNEPVKFAAWAGPGTCVSFRRKFLNYLLPIPEEIRMLADDYIGSLIIFVAPVSAAPECLSGYRFHGDNSFHAEPDQISAEVRKNILRQLQVVHSAMRLWLARNAYTRKQLPVRLFLDWWSLYLESEEFRIEPPGRFRFFWYNVRENYSRSRSNQSWKLTAYNYLTAPAALVIGYKKAHLLHEWRGRVLAALQVISKGVRPRDHAA